MLSDSTLCHSFYDLYSGWFKLSHTAHIDSSISYCLSFFASSSALKAFLGHFNQLPILISQSCLNWIDWMLTLIVDCCFSVNQVKIECVSDGGSWWLRKLMDLKWIFDGGFEGDVMVIFFPSKVDFWKISLKYLKFFYPLILFANF